MQDNQCRRSPRIGSCFVIVTNKNASNANEYEVLKYSYVNQPSQFMMASSQGSLVMRQMPSCMNSVLQSISEKRISCSFCHQFLLNYIGRLSEHNSFSDLVIDYGNYEDGKFSLHCIYAVFHAYICRALSSIAERSNQLPLSRNEYLKMFQDCKCTALERAKEVRESERYLGNNSFEDELRRSFDDFLSRVRTTFGFWPYRIGEERPIRCPI